jgi:hypothetical protein
MTPSLEISTSRQFLAWMAERRRKVEARCGLQVVDRCTGCALKESWRAESGFSPLPLPLSHLPRPSRGPIAVPRRRARRVGR